MRNKLALIFWILIAASGSVPATQSSVDEDSMQVMDDRNKSLSSNLAQINAKGALEDAKQLEEMFVEVEDYFAHKSNANDAVDWSKQSRELASTITKYVASNDFDHASESAATLSKTCKTCHRIYKKKD